MIIRGWGLGMYKSNKNKAGPFSTINLGIIISILTTSVIFILPLTNVATKFIIALIIGISIAFLMSMIISLYQKLNCSKIHDELTGLYNKNFLNECKFRVIAQTDRQHGKMGLVLANVYKLKDIENTYGKKACEEVLRYVGEGLIKTSRASEFIFRLEDNNFLIFFSDINEYSNIKIIKSRLEKFFQKLLIFNKMSIEVKLDFGYAVYPEDGSTFEETYSVAQQRMYVEQRR